MKIDLRSDTVTKPTEEMKKAMYDAELGDDVYEDDPTVNKLQELAAEKTGKEAALLVSSGTMSNLVAILSLAQRGDEAILGDKSHIFSSEANGASVLGGVSLRPVKNQDDGSIEFNDIENAINPIDPHKTKSSILCLENTHNMTGGQPLSPTQISELSDFGRSFNLTIHLDGARIFNSAVALKVDLRDLTKSVDTIGFCLSKGLSCPIGSVICGPNDFIIEAKRWRKMLGGGMRQAGVFAAAGIVGLNSMIDRMEEDHENARKLAFGLSEFSQIIIDPERIKTNIVRFDLKEMDSDDFASRLRKNGVLINGSVKSKSLRMVTHYGIISEDIDYTIEQVSKIIN